MKKVFTKLLAIVIAVMLILSACPVAFAADDDIASGTAGDGINWVIDAEGTLTISGEGAIVTEWNNPPWYDYNDSILNIVVQEGITTIPGTAFYEAGNAVTVSIPASVTGINAYTFWSCTALQEINVDTENQNYISVDGILFSKDKTKLCFYPASKAGNSYTIPDTVTTVGGYAFAWNKQLRSVIIPDTVTTLEYNTFEDACIESITIGSGIKTLPALCFSNCDNLESVVIPDSVEKLETSVFWSCNNLKTVTIGKNVKAIGTYTFNYCDALTAIHYTGTEDTWAAIEIAENNDVLNSLSVHYLTEDDYKEGFDIADCTTNGHTAGLYCGECGVYATGDILLAPGHDYVDGVCQAEGCGYECFHKHEDFDGICDICGMNIGFPEIKAGETKTAYIEVEYEKNYVKFTAETDGEYIITSDNGGNYDIDPYVYLYDSDGYYIDENDDADNGYNFGLIFDATAGETYYFGLSAYESDVEYSYTLQKYIYITHQPTTSEPYVELNNDDGATYQWYTVEKTDTELTDQNADAVAYDWGSSSYDSENGWSGVQYSPEDYPEGYDFFTVSLKAGDTVTVEVIGDHLYGAGLYDYATYEDVWLDKTEDSIYELTVDYDGDYTFYTMSESGDITVKAYGTVYTYTKINGETKAALTNATIGESYACMATADNRVFTSDVFEYTYVITHQPTSAEPYVELNEEADAAYQWYKIEREYGEITDEYADPIDNYGTGASSYSSEIGWHGNYGSGIVDFFEIYLQEGETVKFVFDGTFSNAMLRNEDGVVIGETLEEPAIPDTDTDNNISPDEPSTPDTDDTDTGTDDSTVTITVPASGIYTVSADCAYDAYVRVYANKSIYTEIEGETTNTLTDATVGTSYACKVTVDGKELTSDTFEYAYAITHQPTAAERYVEVNEAEGATYQWYAIEGGYDEITDEDVQPIDNYGTGASSYNSETGWSGSYWPDYSGADFFEINLEEGETVKLIFNGNASDVAIIDYESFIYTNVYPGSDGVVTLTAPESLTYTVAAYCEVGTTVKAYIDNSIYTAVEGETDATLKTDVKGLYVCEVTFADGSTEMSDTVNTNYIPGDVNDDGAVNNRDYALLMQYLNKWDVTINEAAADVTGDGTINNRDYALLMQYLNKWDVELQ